MASDANLPKKDDKNLLTEQIYGILLKQLVNDQLPPGTKLNIDGMSKQLGVSRSPVAAAFSALERDGFLIIVPKNGTFVRDLTREEVKALYMARSALERVVASFAVKNAAPEALAVFRRRLEEFGKRPVTGETDLLACFELGVELHRFLSNHLPEIVRREYGILSNLTIRSRLLTLKLEAENHDIAELIARDIAIHTAIIDAFLAKDTERAARLLEKDTRKTKRNTIKHLY